jgi:hypothetical protein
MAKKELIGLDVLSLENCTVTVTGPVALANQAMPLAYLLRPLAILSVALALATLSSSP